MNMPIRECEDLRQAGAGRVWLCRLLRPGIGKTELERLAAIEAQRDALVREVHHRIKNSLQGAGGLLRRHAGAESLLQGRIATDIPPHGAPGGRVRLELAVDAAGGAAEVRVSNRGSLPTGCCAARGGGSGLRLVRMLLPPQGARFSLRGEKGRVTATLRLSAPAIAPTEL